MPIGAEWMDRASATDLCSAVLLAQRNHLRRCAHRPAVGNARLKGADGASQSGKIVKVFPHG